MSQTRYKERYRLRKEMGLCPLCGKREPVPGGALCEQCRSRQKEEARLRREQAVDLQICPRCRKNRLYTGERRCPECVEKTRQRSIKYRERKNELQRAAYKAKSEEWDGKCIYCHKRPPEQGYKSCSYCRTRRRRYWKKDGIDRSERSSYGLCYMCTKPVMDGKKLCQKHYEQAIANLAKVKAPKTAHWWRSDETKRYSNMKGMKT